MNPRDSDTPGHLLASRSTKFLITLSSICMKMGISPIRDYLSVDTQPLVHLYRSTKDRYTVLGDRTEIGKGRVSGKERRKAI